MIKNKIGILSYINNKKKYISLSNMINKGSYNNIYDIGGKKIIRISNTNDNPVQINSELKGVKIQHKLSKNTRIAKIYDYGMVRNKLENDKNLLREYSIVQKYGKSLETILSNKTKFQNFKMKIKFMYDLLKGVAYIHKNNYAHLDLKPDNILMRNINKTPGHINNIDIVIIDFGGAQVFDNNYSKVIDKQMASAAYSPPEIIKCEFGKPSDIWAYGVICYLLCIGDTFINSNSQRKFMHTDLNILKKNIKKTIMSLKNDIQPEYIQSKTKMSQYLNPIDRSNVHLLMNFFLKIFNINSNSRATASDLLKHDLFKLL